MFDFAFCLLERVCGFDELVFGWFWIVCCFVFVRDVCFIRQIFVLFGSFVGFV